MIRSMMETVHAYVDANEATMLHVIEYDPYTVALRADSDVCVALTLATPSEFTVARYRHGRKEVTIEQFEVVPDFDSALVLALSMLDA